MPIDAATPTLPPGEIYDLADLESHVRAAIRRSGIKRTAIAARMTRFTEVAGMLLDPRISFFSVLSRGITTSELYAALWLLLVADTFGDEGERGGIAGDFFRFTEEELALLDRVWRLLHDRYFGMPATATLVLSKDRPR